MPKLSIVAPCYNEEESLSALVKRCQEAAKTAVDDDFEIILVCDGSTDSTWPKIEAHSAENDHIVGIRLSRNYGQQVALSAGLNAAAGDYIFIIDADLQDPPELLVEMLAIMQSEQADIVYGKRKKRDGETAFKKYCSSLFYRVLSAHSDVVIPQDTGDFRLINKRVVKTFRAMPERDRFVRGMLSWIGLKQIPFHYDRAERFAGETKYSLKTLLKLAKEGFWGFTALPLRLTAFLALMMFLLTGVIMIYALVSWAFLEAASGWTSLMMLISFASGVQLLSLSIIGEYLGRIYESAQGRPLFVVSQVIGTETPDDNAQGVWLKQN